jgi:hypothetical protein
MNLFDPFLWQSQTLSSITAAIFVGFLTGCVLAYFKGTN